MKRFFLICLVVSLMLFTSCSRGQDAKPLSEITTSELKIMLDETWLDGEQTNSAWKATVHYTKAIELELQRRGQ